MHLKWLLSCTLFGICADLVHDFQNTTISVGWNQDEALTSFFFLKTDSLKSVVKSCHWGTPEKGDVSTGF